jgi:hypothetical protein
MLKYVVAHFGKEEVEARIGVNNGFEHFYLRCSNMSIES